MDERDLLPLSHEELYRIFIAKKRDLIEDGLLTEQDVQQINYGKTIKFSLPQYFQFRDSHEWGLFRVKPKSQLINAGGTGYVKIDDFNEELNERIGRILNALLDYYSKPTLPYDGDYGDTR